MTPALLQEALSALAAGVMVVTAEGEVRLANPAAATLWGLEPDALVGRSLRELAPDLRLQAGGTGEPLALRRADGGAGWCVCEARRSASGWTLELHAAAGPGEEAGSSALTGARVLVVEDNLVNQRLASAMLMKLGLVVEVVADGREAVARARAGEHDLIFMDCELPGMDGLAATRAIRDEEPRGRRVPVVAMTAATTPEDRARCLAAGMDDHVAKPMSLVQLREMLTRWLAAGPVSPPMWRELQAELRAEELRELTLLLVRQVAEGIVEMRRRLAAEDLRGIGELAHALGGAAGNLGAVGLAKQLRAIEAGCRGAGPAPDATAFTALAQALGEVEGFFRARLPP